MIFGIHLDCIRHRVSRATNREFTKDYVQQPGTYIQQAHISKSVKGCSSATTASVFLFVCFEQTNLITQKTGLHTDLLLTYD